MVSWVASRHYFALTGLQAKKKKKRSFISKVSVCQAHYLLTDIIYWNAVVVNEVLEEARLMCSTGFDILVYKKTLPARREHEKAMQEARVFFCLRYAFM